MIIFLDTEFTDLVIEPRLLSIGMVAAAEVDIEFYAEVTDRDRIHAACWFAMDVVLPQFGKIARAGCSYASLGARLRVFVERTAATLAPDEPVEIAFTYDLDWDLAQRAMQDAGGTPQDRVWRRLNPRNVYDVTESVPARAAADAYFSRQVDAPIERHHALCDARALRIAFEAGITRRDATDRAASPRPDPPRPAAIG